jgi:hypothetical protein
MQIKDIPFGTTDWEAVEPTFHAGETGQAIWRTRQFGPIRVRMMDYSAGYVSDHWCTKGHIVLVLDGLLVTELSDGSVVSLSPGQSYQVADGAMAHRSRTAIGCKLFVVD